MFRFAVGVAVLIQGVSLGGCFSAESSTPPATLSGALAFPVNSSTISCGGLPCDHPGSLTIKLSDRYCDGGFIALNVVEVSTYSNDGSIAPGTRPVSAAVWIGSDTTHLSSVSGTMKLARLVADAGERESVAEGTFDVLVALPDGGTSELSGTFRTGDFFSCD